MHHGYDIRKLSAEHPVRVQFSAVDDAEARAVMRSLGLVDVPLVTLHVREGGSKRSELRDAARDASIETCLPAVDELVQRGFTVVRIGDPAMTPVKRPGLVDLATHPSRSALVDFWCVKNSQFFVASDSGPYLLSWLFNVLCLALNITNVLGVFPLRHADLYLIKRVQEAASGRPVPLSEMLTEEFLSTLRRRMYKDGALQYVDNDEDDIRSAVLEMVDRLQECLPPHRCNSSIESGSRRYAAAHSRRASSTRRRGPMRCSWDRGGCRVRSLNGIFMRCRWVWTRNEILASPAAPSSRARGASA